MNFNIMQSFQILLLLCMLFGLLMGIWKGFGKSVIRFFVIIAMSIVCFFISAPISKALVTTDISGLGINIRGVQFTNLKESIVALLEQIKPIDELMAASPTFKAFIESVPIMVLNVIVFLLCFFALQAFSNLFSWLLAKLLLKKPKSKEEKQNKHRLLGGLVGLLQGVFVFAVIAVPVFGIIDTANEAIDTIDKYSASSEESSEEASATAAYAIITDSEEGSSENSSNSGISIDTKKIKELFGSFNDLTFVKVFRSVGIAKIENKVFSNLASASVNGEKVSLKEETLIVAKLASKLDSVTKLSANSTEKDFENMRFEINTLFDSKLFSRIGEELVRYAATEWSDETDPTAFGVKKPDLGDAGNKIFDSALGQLKNSTRLTLKDTLLVGVDVLESAADNGIFKALTDKQEGQDLMKTLATNNGKAISDIIVLMVENDTLRAILPDLVQSGLDAVYPTLGIPKDSSEKANKVFGDLVEIINKARTNGDNAETLAAAIEQSMDKNDFNLSGINADVKSTWFNAFATNQLEALSNASIESISTYLHEHTIDLEISAARDFSDMANCKKLTQADLAIRNTLSKEEWKKDATNFAAIFANIYTAFDSTTDENGNTWEAGSEFDHFDFGALGKVFDGMRHSYLLDDQNDPSIRASVSNRVSFNIVKAILESDLLSGINVTQSFITTIETNWDDENFKFENAFNTLGSTVRILNQFNSGDGVSAGAMKDLLNGLSDETTKDAILDIIKDDMFDSGSSDNTLTDAVTDIIDKLSEEAQEYGEISEEQAQKEADALNETLNILNKSNSNEEITSEDVNNAVDNILDSDIVFNAIINSAEESEDIKTKIQEQTTQEDVDTAIGDKRAEIAANEDLSDEEKAALNEKLDKLYELLAGNAE